ncbi:OmpA family protein [Halarcobacter ebronensis]|nr:OmpA family protein [Halarcobacter ebronensis]
MRYLFLSFIVLFFAACNNINLLLLPESNGKVGKIEVQKEDGKVVLVDKAYEKVELVKGTSELLSKEEVSRKYANEINALPKMPENYVLYFEWDSSKVVENSRVILNNLIEKLKKEEISYVDVIGYTDTAGDYSYNKILSLKRANAIRDILVKSGFDENKISVFFYGESNPIVKTGDGVPKKINRRVEVTLK